MIDVFILTAVTSRYLDRRKSKKISTEVQPEQSDSLGRGDDLFFKAGGKRVKSDFKLLFVFFFFIALRLALYYPVNVHVMDYALGGSGSLAKIEYVDDIQESIIRFGGQLFTTLFPLWLPVSVGLNLWNQLDEDFPNKELIRMHRKSCMAESDFSSCGIYLKLKYDDSSPEEFKEAAFALKENIKEETQICEIYGFVMQYFNRRVDFKESIRVEREMCELDICQPKCKYLKYR